MNIVESGISMLLNNAVHCLFFLGQDIKVEGLEVMKVLLERRKVELKEEEEEAERKAAADREVRWGGGVMLAVKAL